MVYVDLVVWVGRVEKVENVKRVENQVQIPGFKMEGWVLLKRETLFFANFNLSSLKTMECSPSARYRCSKREGCFGRRRWRVENVEKVKRVKNVEKVERVEKVENVEWLEF